MFLGLTVLLVTACHSDSSEAKDAFVQLRKEAVFTQPVGGPMVSKNDRSGEPECRDHNEGIEPDYLREVFSPDPEGIREELWALALRTGWRRIGSYVATKDLHGTRARIEIGIFESPGLQYAGITGTIERDFC